jgi:hypothetical protein
VIEYANGRPVDNVLLMSEIDRLQRLVTDLMLLGNGHLSVSDNAPILDYWVRTSRSAPCLAGEVSDHPLLPGNGRLIMTSDVFVIAEDAGCARTLSRWYRLGRPYGSKQSS